MWWLWRGALPVVGDYTLWTYHDTVDGRTVSHPLTVAGLFLALIVVVTAVGVRNIGALLDIVLLQRLDVQPDATYAVKVMAQYALTAAGVVTAAYILGIGWSDVQWLIAALGVGLGFGLQEIFANFISGLIVLAERPIRIGDVVTVGDVSTVARIRARATAVVDFDNKEVIIPNKAFITERAVNWTTPRTRRRGSCSRAWPTAATSPLAAGAARGGGAQPRRAAAPGAVGVLRRLRRQLARLRDPRVRGRVRPAAARARRAAPRRGCGAARARHRDPVPAAGPPHPLGPGGG